MRPNPQPTTVAGATRVLGAVLLLVTLARPAHAQGIEHEQQVTIDVVENEQRRCHNEAGLARECYVAYGHYKAHDTWTKRHLVFRATMRCERDYKDCVALEGGKTYQWAMAPIDEKYPYTWYQDFYYAMYITTPQGKALYACRDEKPVRKYGP